MVLLGTNLPVNRTRRWLLDGAVAGRLQGIVTFRNRMAPPSRRCHHTRAAAQSTPQDHSHLPAPVESESIASHLPIYLPLLYRPRHDHNPAERYSWGLQLLLRSMDHTIEPVSSSRTGP